MIDEKILSCDIDDGQHRLIVGLGERQTFIVNIVEQRRETLNEIQTRLGQSDVQQLISTNEDDLFRWRGRNAFFTFMFGGHCRGTSFRCRGELNEDSVSDRRETDD